MAVDERDQLLVELTALHRQMFERDLVLAQCEDEIRLRDQNLARTQHDLAEAASHIDELTRQIEAMRATRAWRVAEAYWSVRHRVRRVRGRR